MTPQLSNLPLSNLRVWEDNFPTMVPTEKTVVCADIWKLSSFEEWISPLSKKLSLNIDEHGLSEYGIAVQFKTIEEAVIFRMFFDGETVT